MTTTASIDQNRLQMAGVLDKPRRSIQRISGFRPNRILDISRRRPRRSCERDRTNEVSVRSARPFGFGRIGLFCAATGQAIPTGLPNQRFAEPQIRFGDQPVRPLGELVAVKVVEPFFVVPWISRTTGLCQPRVEVHRISDDRFDVRVGQSDLAEGFCGGGRNDDLRSGPLDVPVEQSAAA